MWAVGQPPEQCPVGPGPPHHTWPISLPASAQSCCAMLGHQATVGCQGLNQVCQASTSRAGTRAPQTQGLCTVCLLGLSPQLPGAFTLLSPSCMLVCLVSHPQPGAALPLPFALAACQDSWADKCHLAGPFRSAFEVPWNSVGRQERGPWGVLVLHCTPRALGTPLLPPCLVHSG